jgi:16S rRNA (adenine1518-N6/adenine1519-N6)-dimethyltransferase
MKNIISKYKILAKKSLWQNFLINEDILKNISLITKITNENILEIGPWFWALTSFIISKKPSSLTLVELDNDMIFILNDRLKNWEFNLDSITFEIIKEDVLKYTPIFSDYKVIANIPYYITSPILFKFLYEVENKPSEMIILMQKEVWDRIIWFNNKKTKSSVLSLFVQKKCTVTEKIFVWKECFNPMPKVDSTVLFFQINNNYDSIDDNIFLTFIKASFSNPRKKMVSNLSNFWYNRNDILKKLNEIWFWENTRPEELKIEDYIYLLK